MDEALRDLERRARSGDSAARGLVDREWRRRGLGWRGEVLPEGVRRAGEDLEYVWDAGRKRAIRVALVQGEIAAIVATLRPATDWPGPFLSERLLEELESHGVRLFIFDLGRSEPIYSQDIARLIAYQDALAKRGGRIVLVNLNRNQRQIFDLLGLAGRLTIRDGLEGAIEALAT